MSWLKFRNLSKICLRDPDALSWDGANSGDDPARRQRTKNRVIRLLFRMNEWTTIMGPPRWKIYFRALGGVNDTKSRSEKPVGTGEASPPRIGAPGEIFDLARPRLWTY
jgi:hypothetical protein